MKLIDFIKQKIQKKKPAIKTRLITYKHIPLNPIVKTYINKYRPDYWRAQGYTEYQKNREDGYYVVFKGLKDV